MKRSMLMITLALFAILLQLLHSFHTFAQSTTVSPAIAPTIASTAATTTIPTPTHDEVLEQIRNYARQHVETGVAMNTQLAVNRFHGVAQGLSDQDIAQTYEDEYIRLKEDGRVNPFTSLLPPGPLAWLALVLILCAYALRDFLLKILGNIWALIGGAIYNRFAGSKLFRGIALRRYRASLADKHKYLIIAIGSSRKIDLKRVYVPLEVSEKKDDKKAIDAYQALRQYRRLMVTGDPGAGKSTLLRHILLSYAEERLVLEDRSIPIMLNLYRLNEDGKTIEQHLVEAFRLDGFPRADGFVTYNLKHGRLLLLLDGLDEVNTNRRPDVIRQIKDLLTIYRKCRVVITCRSAVYHQEFAGNVEQTLNIVEFTDQQIWRFLKSWKMQAGRSAGQLIESLKEKPNILELARNPLLLTIIAFMYDSDLDFTLPYSRADFYAESTAKLLGKKDDVSHTYKEAYKRFILRKLALFFQERATQVQQDRRSVDMATVLEQVRSWLAIITLRDQDTEPIIDEIVERSSLLLFMEREQRYTFPHLTLQEYFAAESLLEDRDRLLKHFRADPDTWRETVKLWCGLAAECSELVKQVYQTDDVTAFECLGDAKKIDQSLAEAIISSMKPRLNKRDDDYARIIQAFGLVAAGREQQNSAVFHFLQTTLADDTDAVRQISAARALALTNLPEAAEFLVKQYIRLAKTPTSLLGELLKAQHHVSQPPSSVRQDQHADESDLSSELRKAIIRMGDVTIATLRPQLKQGDLSVLEILQLIGTPQAARELVPVLWDDDQRTAEHAAWYLAMLFQQHSADPDFCSVRLTDGQRQRTSERLDWVWEPFQPDGDTGLIAGRIGYLLAQGSGLDTITKIMPLDPRIIVPLIAVHKWNQWYDAYNNYYALKNGNINKYSSLGTSKKKNGGDISALFNFKMLREFRSKGSAKNTGSGKKAVPSSLLCMMEGLSPKTKEEFHSLVLKSVKERPTRDDWRNTSRNMFYDANSSIEALVAVIIFFVLSAVVAGYCAWYIVSSYSSRSTNIFSSITLLLIASIWLCYLSNRFMFSYEKNIRLIRLVSLAPFYSSYTEDAGRMYRPRDNYEVGEELFYCLLFIVVIGCVGYTLLDMLAWNYNYRILLILIWIFIFLLYSMIAKKKRRARNPLGALAKQISQEMNSRSS